MCNEYREELTVKRDTILGSGREEKRGKKKEEGMRKGKGGKVKGMKGEREGEETRGGKGRGK